MSLSVVVSQAASRAEVKSFEVGVSQEDGLGDLITKLRQVQRQTNEYLTAVISESGADAKDDNDECEDEEESDEEPENKVPKLQWISQK